MTAPTLDLGSLPVEDTEGVPNFRATSTETGEPKPSKRGPTKSRGAGFFGRTGGASSNFAGNEKPHKEPPPKLSPGMKQSISDLYQFVGATIRPFDEFLGDTIIEQADKCADSVYKLAQQNDAVRRMVIAFSTTSITGAVVMAHLPILLAVARHSKNEKVRMTAGGTMMALKFADAATTADLFPTDQDSPPNGGE